jgi:arginine N-succinyltransferase
MGPLTPDSNTLFWEFFGRRFINLSYSEADAFCQHSKEFMLSLLPKEEIYLSTLPAEARNLVGKVGNDTAPAKAMLEKQGFRYHDRCDPFDGGPYLEAQVDEIPLVRETRRVVLAAGESGTGGTGFVSCAADTKLGFRAVRSPYALEGGRILLPASAAAAIGAREGSAVGLTVIGAGA